MTTLTHAVDHLIEQARQSDSIGRIREASQAVMAGAHDASLAERHEAVASLAAALDPERIERSGWLALTGGAIVETGAGFAPLAQRLIACLPAIAQQADGFGNALLAHALSVEESEQLEEEADHSEWVGERYVDPDAVYRCACEHRDGADAWYGLGHWAKAAIACLTRDGALRKQALAALAALRPMAAHNHHLASLSTLLSVLDDEPVIVIHPAAGAGFRLRMSGIVDNFQLHTLLNDLLMRPPASLAGARPHPQAVAVAAGSGPHQSDAPSTGAWDMYDWRALAADGTLPAKVPTTHWIWGEGTPGDIPRFGNDRIILLAAPSYERSWNTVRYFDALRAEVVLDDVIAQAQVQALLQQMGRAGAGLPA